MITLTIRVRGEKQTFTHKEFLADHFPVHKDNKELEELVRNVCKISGIEEIETVHIISRFEW